MIPNAAEVARRRWTVTTCLRVGSLLVALPGVTAIASWLSEGISDGDLFEFYYYGDRIIMAVFFFGAAIGCFCLARRFSRFFVPIRTFSECPACRHRIEGVTTPRCTECGLTLTAEFLTGEMPPPTPELDHARRVMVRRETVASVFRVVGVFSIPVTLLWSAASMYYLLMWTVGSGFTESYEFAGLLSNIMQTGVLTTTTVVLLRFSRRLAAWCVPFGVPNPAAIQPGVMPEP